MAADDDAEKAAFQLAEQLRDVGLDIDLPTSGSVGKKLKKADRNGIRVAVILGSDEMTRNVVQLRNLSTGEQQEISLSGDDTVAPLATMIADNLQAP